MSSEPIIFIEFAISAIKEEMNKLINFLVVKINEMSFEGTDGNKETVDKLWQFSET